MVLYDVIVIGGGLAGLTSALHLAKKDLSVLLIEQHPYPRHKVCGEYLSNEILPYWKALGVDPFEYGAKKIDQFTLSTPQGRSITTKLPLGGFGISRYRIDWELAEKAKEAGATIVHAKVIETKFENHQSKTTLSSQPSHRRLRQTLQHGRENGPRLYERIYPVFRGQSALQREASRKCRGLAQF